jgi:hypothetical protein
MAKEPNGNGRAHAGNGKPIRGAGGRYLPGHGAPGPGRPPGPSTVADYLAHAAIQLAEPLQAARDAVAIARELCPAALLRTVEILQDPATEPAAALAAARLILERGYGLPSQSTAVLNLDATVMTTEQRQQAQAAGAAALKRLLSLARPAPSGETVSESAGSPPV